jgi:hypothetical protein
MTEQTPSGGDNTPSGANKPSRFPKLRSFGNRLVAAKIPLLVFLVVSGALTAVLVWWAFFLLPQDHRSSASGASSISSRNHNRGLRVSAR